MPHIIVVQGALGAGKTTLASIMAYLYKNKIVSAGGSVQLFSNYGLSGSTQMKDYKDWYKVAEAQGSICIWDEAHRIMDARQALKAENILTSHVLTFARKMSAIQIFVTPVITNLDSRLRQLCEVLISVTKVGNKGMKFQYFDYQSQNFGVFGKFLHSRFLSAAKVKQIHALNLFDSHSFVSGFPLPKTERLAEQFMIELENQHDKARGNSAAEYLEELYIREVAAL
jgi:SpoVK/Ycf46/Vps4 family AAA+-type ATPase